MRRRCSLARAEGQQIGLVATLGALHEGHISLLRKAHSLSDFLVVSIFVNPTQFGPGEDLERYPRTLEDDLEICDANGVDVVFTPDVEGMYATGHKVYIDEDKMSGTLCGRTRQGHFRGVLTVVAKLFNIVQPDLTVFGQKDAQQARLVQRMIDDLKFPIAFHLSPIVRESDGLAISSRNRYLDGEMRERARCLHAALLQAGKMYEEGERDANVLRQAMAAVCHDGTPPVEVEYIELVAYETLEPVESVASGTLIALAVKVGDTRLIDNIML